MDMLQRSLKLLKIPWIVLHNHDYLILWHKPIDDHFFVFVHSICGITMNEIDQPDNNNNSSMTNWHPNPIPLQPTFSIRSLVLNRSNATSISIRICAHTLWAYIVAIQIFGAMNGLIPSLQFRQRVQVIATLNYWSVDECTYIIMDVQLYVGSKWVML